VPSPFAEYEVDAELRPIAQLFDFDLDRRLSSVLVLEASISDDAASARTMGTHREGNAIVIGAEGLILTISYLITEAEEVTVSTGDGPRIPAHVLGIDQATGLGLIHALEPLGLPALPIGDSRKLRPEAALISAGAAASRTPRVAGRWLERRSPDTGSTSWKRPCSSNRRIHTGAARR
jgi:S1-C subfamily serine protease